MSAPALAPAGRRSRRDWVGVGDGASRDQRDLDEPMAGGLVATVACSRGSLEGCGDLGRVPGHQRTPEVGQLRLEERIRQAG